MRTGKSDSIGITGPDLSRESASDRQLLGMEVKVQGRFVDPEALGEGGMGSVFVAADPRLERKVALKVIHSDLQGKSDIKERFLREARSQARLQHPNIPPVYELGETEDGSPYFALKLIDGENLEEVIKRLKEGDPATHAEFGFMRRLQICAQLARTLEYAHSQGVVHRDVKPANVMMGKFGEVWLVDWGLAAPPSEAPTEERLTQPDSFVGTLECAAPEQLAGTNNAASEQYSLGVLMYEFFSLHPAHPGKNHVEKMRSALNEVPRSAELFTHPQQGRVPREVSRLIEKALQKKPEERFASLSEMTHEIETIIEGDIPAVCPHTAFKKGMYRFGKFLDRHNYWFMPLLMLWLAYPLKDIVWLLWSQISPWF